MIDGVQVVPLQRIPDERGTVLHMLKRTDPHFREFGEIYFSTVYRDVVKGWHKHARMALNYCCVHGRIKLVLYDDREASTTRGELQEIFLGPDNYALVVVPENVWNGFKGMAAESIVANCATLPHDPAAAGTVRMSPFDTTVIAYNWDVRHE